MSTGPALQKHADCVLLPRHQGTTRDASLAGASLPLHSTAKPDAQVHAYMRGHMH